MIQTGHGRPLRALALGALLFLTLLIGLAPDARAASQNQNVFNAILPRPGGDDVVLAKLTVRLAHRDGSTTGSFRSARVRRTGGGAPSGYRVAAVSSRPRGSRLVIRLVAVSTGDGGAAGGSLHLRLRLLGRDVMWTHASTRTLRISPDVQVRGAGDCRTIRAEAARWKPVAGLARATLAHERFSARTAVGAAEQIACDRTIPAVPQSAAARFLSAVDDAYDKGSGGKVEGFFATWTRAADGRASICVYVRGAKGGDGDVTISGSHQAFTLDDANGVANVATPVPGPGDYVFTVRWRQSDGTFRESESSINVPAGGAKGNDPPPPYDAAGPCA